MTTLDVERFLEDLTGQYAEPYTIQIQAMLEATLRGNKVALSLARRNLNEVMRNTMGVAEVLGASTTLKNAAAVPDEFPTSLYRDHRAMLAFAAETQALIPSVTLTEMIENMISRVPVTLTNAAERTAQRIAELYSEGNVVAFVRSAEDVVTRKAQSIIVQAMKAGTGEVDVGRLLVKGVDEARRLSGAWSESYSRMVFRTNVNTAHAAGMFRQSQDPDVKAVAPCFRFDTARDVDVRHNHGPADGLILKVDNVLWAKIAPPLGYNCRCKVSSVTLPMLRRMGRISSTGEVIEDRGIPAGAFPDPKFRHGGRPDLFMVAVTK